MLKHAFRFLIKLIPRRLRMSVGYKLLRESGTDLRAYTDLFNLPYSRWVDWRSGIGQGHLVLYALVRAMNPATVVEIGSARGKSTCTMALACRQNGYGKVFAIDPHDANAWAEGEGNSLEFLQLRLREYGLEEWCEIIRATSCQAGLEWKRPIDLLFIDGDHTYDGVKGDFETFQPWLTDRSVVVFHDSLWEYQKDDPFYRPDIGVPRYLEELKRQGFHSVTLPMRFGMTFLCPTQGGFQYVYGSEPNLEVGRIKSEADANSSIDNAL
jgi:predicted O-methyltransferase YrrM